MWMWIAATDFKGGTSKAATYGQSLAIYLRTMFSLPDLIIHAMSSQSFQNLENPLSLLLASYLRLQIKFNWKIILIGG